MTFWGRREHLRTENRSVVARSWRGGGRVDYKGEQGILGSDRTVLYHDYSGSYMNVYVGQNLQNYALKR